MNGLDVHGQRLLEYLVKRLDNVIPGKPETYTNYKEIHDKLNLKMTGRTYGESLKIQGLLSLANWTVKKNMPGITGIIIDRDTKMPGEGYFRVFGRDPLDIQWWNEQIRLSKHYDWSPYLPIPQFPETPKASDINEPTKRQEITTHRIIRDTNIAKRVKALYQYKCQICEYTITLPDGSKYVEAHHIQPLGEPHNGPDVMENIICVCPNHHAELDYGAIKIVEKEFKLTSGQKIGTDFINYHNKVICKI